MNSTVSKVIDVYMREDYEYVVGLAKNGERPTMSSDTADYIVRIGVADYECALKVAADVDAEINRINETVFVTYNYTELFGIYTCIDYTPARKFINADGHVLFLDSRGNYSDVSSDYIEMEDDV